MPVPVPGTGFLALRDGGSVCSPSSCGRAAPQPRLLSLPRSCSRWDSTMENPNSTLPTILPIPVAAGKHYTIYAVSESAMTTRREVLMCDVLAIPEFRPAYVGSVRGKWRLGTFKEGRKRTVYWLDVDAVGTLIVPGTLLGVPADHEKWSSFAMSATLNLAATPDRIRELVSQNINANFANHDRIVAYPAPLNPGAGDNGILVFPDAPSRHAVILKMRERGTEGA